MRAVRIARAICSRRGVPDMWAEDIAQLACIKAERYAVDCRPVNLYVIVGQEVSRFMIAELRPKRDMWNTLSLDGLQAEQEQAIKEERRIKKSERVSYIAVEDNTAERIDRKVLLEQLKEQFPKLVAWAESGKTLEQVAKQFGVNASTFTSMVMRERATAKSIYKGVLA